jgi:hypothetical protein
MNVVDALLRVYPPSWRGRHEAEFRDALSSTIGPSGRLPFREVRSAVAGGVRERARGESTTPRELVRSALNDSLIFISGMLVGIPTFLAVRDGLPVSGFPAILFLIPLALFVSSIASAASFRRVALASGPFAWLAMSGLVTRGSNTNSSRQLFSPGAFPFAAIGLLSFAGLAMFFRHRRWIGAVLQVPTLGLAFRGLWMLHRPRNYLGTQGAFVEVRMAWATGFLALQFLRQCTKRVHRLT